MTEEQKQAVLTADLNRAIQAGGNIYFLAQSGSHDGKSYQQMAGSMTGMTEEEYRDMMVSGGRSSKAIASSARTACPGAPSAAGPRRRKLIRKRYEPIWHESPLPFIPRISPQSARRWISAGTPNRTGKQYLRL